MKLPVKGTEEKHRKNVMSDFCSSYETLKMVHEHVMGMGRTENIHPTDVVALWYPEMP